MDIFQNQCSESLGFDSMLAANPLNSPLQSTESPTHLNFNSSPYFVTIPAPSSTVVNSISSTTLSSISCTSTGTYSSGPNDVVLPSIFVKVPMQINQQYQQQNQSVRSNPEEIKCEDKSEPIKRELGDLRALEKGTAMVQLPSISESYLEEDRQEEELRVHCCEFCPFVTLVEQSLRDHVRVKHPNREREVIEFLVCPACENKFRQRNLLELHLAGDHMMVQSEVTLFMDRRFPRVQDSRESTGCDGSTQEANAVPVSESQSTVAPEQNRRRIYIKNVQLLKKPDVIEQENVHQAQQQHQQQQQQQHQQTAQQQQLAQNGKIYIRNVSLLQNANYVQNVDNVFQNPSGLHESKYSFVVPAPSPNSQSPPISIGEPVNGTTQRSKIFIRNVDILRNPMIPITPPTITSTCEMSRASSSESLYTTPPPTMVSPATSVSSIGTPSSMGFSGLNMVILPTPTCSSNSSTPPTISTPPSLTVANFESVQSQQQPPKKSKIFIKNISVLKQPTIHLKSVDELNLMTIDQLQLQNLLPPTNSAQSMEGSDLSGTGGQQSMEEEEDNFGNILDEVPSDLDDFNVEGNQYQEMQGCDSACGSVTEQGPYQQEFNNGFIIIEPGNSSENVTYEEAPDHLRIPPHTNELMNHQQLPQPPPDPPESQQYHHTDEDILFVCAEEIINLDPPVPHESASSETSSIEISHPPAPPSPAPPPQAHQPPQLQQGRIYVSENLMEPNAPTSLPTPPPVPLPPPPSPLPVHDATISPLNQIEQIKISSPTGHPSEYQLPQTSSGMDKERTRSRGRPKGARQTGITKLKKLYTNLTPMEEGYKCDQGDCGARFRQLDTLTYHKKCHLPSADGTPLEGNRCPECGSQEFRNWNTLHTHLWREHSIDMELYSCHLCNFKTPVLCRLNNTHMKIHSDEKNFICAICNKAFKNNKQLRNHRRSHRDLNQIQQAKECQQQEMETRCGRHLSLLPVKCVQCKLVFPNQKFLKTHVESNHAPDCPDVEGRMKCSICGMVFKTRYLLHSHVAKHSDQKRFKCSSCDFSCNDHNSMRRHKMRHNSEAHMYRCSYCDYTSIQSTTYRKHLERMHAEVAPNLLYKCSDCAFVSISEVKYQLHRAKHKMGNTNPVPEEPDPSRATSEPPDQTTEEEPERLCESVNSDVVIVEKDSSEPPPMDAFSLIPPTVNEQHDQQFPLIRPAGFAHNLSKVDNFYGYGNVGPVDNGGHHYQQPAQPVAPLQPTTATVEHQDDVQMIETDVGNGSGALITTGGSNGHQQHGYDSLMNNIAAMVPLTFGESALGS